MQAVAVILDRISTIRERIGMSPVDTPFAPQLERAVEKLGGARYAVASSGYVTLGQAVAGALSPSPVSPTDAGWAPPLPGLPSSGFGFRTDPFTGERKFHTGVDIGAPAGTPIHAAGAGVVSYAGPRGGYGNVVIIDHPDGKQTYYAHQSRIDVTVGRQVVAGQTIGAVGSTGRSTGPHLHFEVREDGKPIDPALIFPDYGGHT